MNLLDNLNPAQQKVVTSTEGPVLVLAGAGSGKTRSVIYRTAYLINNKKINPWNILVVTFTNKAARELKDRLENTFNLSTHSLWIGTFHSICTRILRYEQAILPFTSNFSIYDENDQKVIFKRLYKKLDIDPKSFPIARVRNIISRQKNSLILPKDFFEFNERNYYSEKVIKIYETYQKYLLENNALDFDDLLMYTAILLHDDESIRNKYEKIFQYVMIDEYQDTNYAQFKIVNLIARNHQNLCVVGDDDQAIYSWRGADIRNILEFERDYKNVVKIKLVQNYRSPNTILNLANSLIKFNSQRHEKELWTEIISVQKPSLSILENENEEARFIADKVQNIKLKNENLNECVILYRTNAQSRVFENAFIQKNMKYQIVGGVNFYQRKEIKDIIAYLRLLANPQDSESLLRIINFPTRGIGKATIAKIINYATMTNISIFESVLSKENYLLKGSAAKRVQSFATKVIKWMEVSKEKSIAYLVMKIIDDLNLMDIYGFSDDPQDISRFENIKEFITATNEFSENIENETGQKPFLTEYLQNISLHTDLDSVDENEESVKLMTMHNAKGLEFDNVFIVGLENGLLPHSKSMDNEKELEEERRLLYVAITRTKKNLALTYAKARRVFDAVQRTLPSRFLMEFDDDLLEKENHVFYELQSPKRQKKPQKSVILESQKYFKVGQKIIHAKFGNGIILNVDGIGKDAKLTISFSNGMLKKIIGSYVKIS